MTLHPQAKAFLDLVSAAPPLDTQTPEQNRQDLLNALPLTGKPANVHAVEDREIPGPAGPIPVRVYTPRPGREPRGGVAYFHGGGWVLGDLDVFDSTARDIALAGDIVVVTVDYRLAPESPFPAAIEDALAVTRSMLAGSVDGVNKDLVAVAGDSAGGNLAAVVAQELRTEPGLRHQVLVYPVMQALVGSTPSYREFAEGHFATRRDMQYFFDCYAPDVDPMDPLLAPLINPNLSGLPSATIITAECDPLRDEGEMYAGLLQTAGNSVLLRRFDGQVHPFVAMGGVIDDALEARRMIGERLATAFVAAAAFN